MRAVACCCCCHRCCQFAGVPEPGRIFHARCASIGGHGHDSYPYSEPVITVVEYDPAWPEHFEMLRNEYAAAMAGAGVTVVAIEHVGSTSVPGLAAKPIIDCDIVVREADVVAASNVLMSLGFTPLGELGIPQRWAFKEPARLSETNTYVIVDGCLSLRNHLAVREVLRDDAALRDEYAAIKRQAGVRAANIDEYGQAKTGMVQKILAAAGLSDGERASIPVTRCRLMTSYPGRPGTRTACSALPNAESPAGTPATYA
jgi:GrpB-like predicted nucleotidyltransferase (UPF0157 family)